MTVYLDDLEPGETKSDEIRLHAIKQFRVSKGWTQEELGKRAGIGQHRVSLIERGLKPKPEEKDKLLRAFGLKD